MPAFTSYKDSVDFMYTQLPMYHNIGKIAYKEGVENTFKLLETLGNPHLNRKWIHVAGTNGKGSVSSMLSATFSQHGYKTGLYTSPHLLDFRERIRIDGICISEDTVLSFVNLVYDDIVDIQPSFFEITVALAFYHFNIENIDIGIIEVGLGGRLDSTNVITPILSVITNISYDHTDLLGNTLTLIASEKAGIVKSGVPLAMGPMPQEPRGVIQRIAKEKSSKVYETIPVDRGFEKILSLKGNYQKENIQTFSNAIEAIKDLYFPIKRSLVLKALSNINQLTGLRGRWEILETHPLVIADIAHNEQGVRAILEQLASVLLEKQTWVFEQCVAGNRLEVAKTHFVWGMVSDKDRATILALLPKDGVYYFCKPSVIRGCDADTLRMEAHSLGLQGMAFGSVSEALRSAYSAAKLQDIIYIGGSTFVVADALPWIDAKQ